MSKCKSHINQMSLFDFADSNCIKKDVLFDYYNQKEVMLSESDIVRLEKYDLDAYISDLEIKGLADTWNCICRYILDFGENDHFLTINNFGELYEIGLAVQDKLQKKKSGQYYTPDDVALVMSEWLSKCDGTKVCDVACGTGKLILTYLDYIGYDSAIELISSGNLYLYDLDHIALKICKTALMIKYGKEYENSIHDIYCDFLDKDIKLPNDCKVISNPPYAGIEKIQDYWEIDEVISDTKELYSSFMSKIFQQAKSTVIITPFSFVSGAKFYSLRREMCSLGNGFIVSFDNVPGNIFCGRKHGIFNTNTANSVRASITVLNNSNIKGFRVSPLIRFKNEERSKLLKCNVLEKELSSKIQLINSENESFIKIHNSLEKEYHLWTEKSNFRLKDLICQAPSDYIIDIPNTCRYFTTGSSKKLSRGGSITLHTNDYELNCFLYCFINSSFAYWWWRLFDGGITYPVSLLLNMPIPYNLLKSNDKKFFVDVYNEMTNDEKEYIVTKVNAGVVQENIKFPQFYRDKINNKILEIIGSTNTSNIFNIVHSNKYFK